MLRLERSSGPEPQNPGSSPSPSRLRLATRKRHIPILGPVTQAVREESQSKSTFEEINKPFGKMPNEWAKELEGSRMKTLENDTDTSQASPTEKAPKASTPQAPGVRCHL